MRLTVNGVEGEIGADPATSLLRVVREELGLTGAKYGCGEGECGACTVLVDGEPRLSCQVTLAEVAGGAVTTVEGLAAEGNLHPVQAAFVAEEALQCGFCTSGMVLATVALLGRDPDPDPGRVRSALEQHLCRCGAHPRIIRAVQRAAHSGRESRAVPVEPVPPSDPAERGAPFDLTAALDRPYFNLMSDGLVSVLAGQAPTHEGARWGSGGAFLHVGGTGGVTAFTGKVDGGQDNRTALSQLVAEELRVDLSRVVLVMGDTDFSPFDVGTFGSRSMPDAGLELRRVAVAAREGLVELAAERWGVGPGELDVRDGVVLVSSDPSRQVGFGELVRGRRDIREVSGAEVLTPPDLWRTAGVKVGRRTSPAAVTGSKLFPSDLVLPGMLHGRILPRPFAAAELRSVDLSAAEGVAGVQLIREGDVVGALGEDPDAVSRALGMVRATWSEPPGVSSDSLAQYLRSHLRTVEGWGGAQSEVEGDPESAIATSSRHLTASYTIPYIAHVPLEPRAALANWSGGVMTVWTGTQRPFGVRREVAEALGLPESAVRVVVPDFGGGFGGKHSGEIAVSAALLARRADGPVRVGWTREEEFTQGYLRPAAVIDVNSAVGEDGSLLAWDFLNINSGAAALRPPYRIPHLRLRYQPADSPLRQGSYRALAATANNFAREVHIDELAHLVAEDPLQYRLRHLSDPRLAEVLGRVAERAGWDSRPRGNGRGLGLAGGLEKDGRIATCAEVEVSPGGDLRVVRIVTGFDCGAIVSPGNLQNQVEGATIMGLGGALFEAIELEGGRIRNPSLGRYRVPRFSDVPPIEVILVDRTEEEPAGAGETPIIAVAPAISNAIFAAVGRRIRSLPLAPGGTIGGGS